MTALTAQLRQLLADLQEGPHTACRKRTGPHRSSGLVYPSGQTIRSRPGHEHAQVTKEPARPLVIGVLALQGAYDAHVRTLTALGAPPGWFAPRTNSPVSMASSCPAANPPPCSNSSSAMASSKSSRPRSTTPTFGTCAGAILLAAQRRTPRSAASPPSTSLSSATPTDARSTPPSSPPRPPSPAARSKWSSSAPRASPARPRRRNPRQTATASPTLVRSGQLSPPPSTLNLPDSRVHKLFLDMVRENARPGEPDR